MSINVLAAVFPDTQVTHTFGDPKEESTTKEVYVGLSCSVSRGCQTDMCSRNSGDSPAVDSATNCDSYWTIWLDAIMSRGNDDDRGMRFVEVGKVSNVEDLLKKLSEFDWSCHVPSCIAITRVGVSPIWEDEAHRWGGRFALRRFPDAYCREFYTRIAVRVLLGEIPDWSSITCCSVSIKEQRCQLQLWSADINYSLFPTMTYYLRCILGYYDETSGVTTPNDEFSLQFVGNYESILRGTKRQKPFTNSNISGNYWRNSKKGAPRREFGKRAVQGGDDGVRNGYDVVNEAAPPLMSENACEFCNFPESPVVLLGDPLASNGDPNMNFKCFGWKPEGYCCCCCWTSQNEQCTDKTRLRDESTPHIETLETKTNAAVFCDSGDVETCEESPMNSTQTNDSASATDGDSRSQVDALENN